MSRARHFILVFCMLWMPLQSVAASLAGAHCAEGVTEAYVHDATPCGLEMTAASVSGDDSGNTSSETFSGNVHDCHHHHFALSSSGPGGLSERVQAFLPDPSVEQPTFSPESPRRPPRPALA